MGDTKKCSECLAEIPKEAKKCQHCGSKQKGKIGIIGWTFIIIGGFILIPQITTALYNSGASSSFPSASQPTPNAEILALQKKNKDKRDKATVDEFTNDRAAVIRKINILFDSDDLNGVVSTAKRFTEAGVKDEELSTLVSKAKVELTRLANLNKTGIWTVGYFVDEFGKPTKEEYIRNTEFISGAFSNSATQDSKLNVKFLISGSKEVAVQLYEYAGRNPVKAYTTTKYTVLLEDKDGKRSKLAAQNWSERLVFGASHSKKVHSSFMKGGTVTFRIYETERSINTYSFSVNSTWYENAYRKLKES